MIVETLITVYYAKVYSTVWRNITIWGQSSDRCQIFTIQKWIIRFLLVTNFRDGCREIFRINSILTVLSIYFYEILSSALNNLDTFRKLLHDYEIRNSYKIYLKCHTRCTKSPHYAGFRVYNHLPSILNKHI